MHPTLKTFLLSLGLGIPLAASAQDTLEEIVVTAKFRDSALMSTSGSISVMNAQLLMERGAEHLEDVLSAAPNVSWSTGASRARFLQVRGVGDLEQYAEPKYYPAVGILLDDLELGSAANAGMLFDVAQVEILRGPQGTRFGASAHAGMVNIRSREPTQEFAAQLSGGLGNYDSYQLGAVLNGPLTDTLSARLAVQQNESDGFIDNAYLGRDDSAGFDELTARLRVRWEPTDTSRYDFNLFSFDSDNGYDAYSLDNDRTTQADQPGRDQQDTLGLTAKGQWELGSSTRAQALISNTDSDMHYSYDGDWVNPDYCVTYTCSGGADRAQEIFQRDRDQTTFDLRLLGGDDTLAARQWRYVAGLYGNRTTENLDYAYPSDWYGLYQSQSRYQTQRYAGYGEIEYGVSDTLGLSASARLEQFEDDYRDSNGVKHDNDDTLWSVELSADYTLGDNSYLYATLSLADKPGGVNVNASSQYAFMSPAFQAFMGGKQRFDKETLFSQELGIKTVLLDNRLSLRAALFHASRDNAQLENWMWDNDAGLWIGYLDSTSDASSYGLEVESSFSVSDRLALFANLGLLQTEVDSISTFDLDAWDFVDKTGREQSKSPQYQFNAGVRAAFSDQLSAVLEVEGRDDSYFGYYHDGKLEGYELLNASLNWSGNKLSVTLWGRNLTDEEYATHGLYFGADPRDDFGAWGNDTYAQFGAPRTYGLQFSYWL